MKTPTDTDNFGIVIAARQIYRTNDRSVHCTVELGVPRELPQHGTWGCPVLFRGVDGDTSSLIEGVDAFNTLSSALEFIRIRLDGSPYELTFDHGVAGDPGFPRYVPYMMGWELTQRLNRVLDREIEQIGSELRKRAGHHES